jgi:hypothetical protein
MSEVQPSGADAKFALLKAATLYRIGEKLTATTVERDIVALSPWEHLERSTITQSWGDVEVARYRRTGTNGFKHDTYFALSIGTHTSLFVHREDDLTEEHRWAEKGEFEKITAHHAEIAALAATGLNDPSNVVGDLSDAHSLLALVNRTASVQAT